MVGETVLYERKIFTNELYVVCVWDAAWHGVAYNDVDYELFTALT